MASGRRMPFVVSRMGAYKTVLATVLLITLVVATVLAALAVYDGRALREGAYQRLSRADSSIAVTAASSSAAQFATQTAAVRAAARSALGPGAGTLDATLWADPQVLTAAEVPAGERPATAGTQYELQLAGFDGLSAHASLVSGAWPRAGGGAVQAAVPVSVASDLRLRAGSTLALHDSISGGTVSLVISGVYAPDPATDSYWDQNQIGPNGVQSAPPYLTFGPLAVAPGDFAAGRLTADQASWIVQPSTAALAAADPAAEQGAVSSLVAGLQHSSTPASAQVATTLPAQLTALRTARDTARAALEGIALTLLTLTVAALIVSSRPLGAQREPETVLLALRGRSRRQALTTDLGEAALLGGAAVIATAPAGTILATALGGDGPLGASRGSAGSGPPAAIGAELGATGLLPTTAAWLAALGVALLAALILVTATAGKQNPDVRGSRSSRDGRVGGVARAGADLAVLALAAAAYWQLRTLPLSSSTAAGSASVDPLTAVVPALALLAAALLFLRLLPLAARLADRIAARGRRVGPAVSAWQISRRPAQHHGAALLTVLAVAAGTFALCEHATLVRSIGDQSAYTVGAQVQVNAPGSVAAAQTAGAVAADPRVTAATGVVQTTGYNGSVVLAMQSTTAPRTVLLRADQYSADPAALWRALRAQPPPAITLPGRPTALSLDAALSAPRAADGSGLSDATLTLAVESADGEFYNLAAQPLRADGRTHTLDFPLSSALGTGVTTSSTASTTLAYPVRLAGISLGYQAPASRTAAAELTLSTLRSTSAGAAVAAPLSLASWAAQAQSASLQQAVQDSQGFTGTPAARLGSTVGAPSQNADGSWTQVFNPGYGTVTGFDASGAALPGSSPAQAGVSLAPDAAGPLPALATSAFLHRSDLAVGSLSQINADGQSVAVRIVGSVAAFPVISAADFTGGLIVDEDALQYHLLTLGLPPLAPTAWWLSSTDGAAPAGLPPSDSTATLAATRAAALSDPLSAITRQGLDALAVVAGVLAALALGAAVAAARRERLGQQAVLDALGVSPRRQALLHAAERLAVAIPAAAVGLGLGLLFARVLLPYLVLTDTATTPMPPALLAVDWLPALALGAVVIAAPVLAAALGATLRPDTATRIRSMETE